MADRGDGEVAKRVDLGLPTALGPGEVEAFLEKGLLRTDMARVGTRGSVRTPRSHGVALQVRD